MAEIKQKYQEKLKEGKGREGEPAYHLKFAMHDAEVFNDINDLITNAAERVLSKTDRERVKPYLLPRFYQCTEVVLIYSVSQLDAFMERFLKPFFYVPKKGKGIWFLYLLSLI